MDAELQISEKMVIRKLVIAATLVVAIVCTSKYSCYASDPEYDDEEAFSDSVNERVTLPEDIDWKSDVSVIQDEKGRKVKYVLSNQRVSVYIDGNRVFETPDGYLVQDMIIADVNEGEETDPHLAKEKSRDEIILILWKVGRYGPHRPFWVDKDETSFSQHIFVYNISGEKVIQKWASSYMGAEAESVEFKDGILYLTYRNGRSVPWKWNKFGFKRVEDTDIFVAGDNLMHVEIYQDALRRHDGNFEYLYDKCRPYIKDAELSFINLETPLVNDPARYSTYPVFGSPVQIAKALKDTGFDGVSLSTNHRFDKGASGIDETLAALDEQRLLHVGSMDEKPYILVKRNEIVFALMNYTYGTNGIRPPKGYEKGVNYLTDEDKIREDIREAKANSDFVIVFPHWGTEYALQPDSYQNKWRDVFYEEGVDAVVGTHPHVIQKYEMYKPEGGEREMLIYYSLGNYISSNQRGEHNSGGLALFSVRKTPAGVEIINYDFVKIDSMFNAWKYE